MFFLSFRKYLGSNGVSITSFHVSLGSDVELVADRGGGVGSGTVDDDGVVGDAADDDLIGGG